MLARTLDDGDAARSLMFAVDDLRPLFGRAYDSPEQSTLEVKTPNFDRWFLE